MTRICQHPDCKKHPCYRFAGNKPLYCATHRLEGMIDVKNKRCEKNSGQSFKRHLHLKIEN